MGKLPRSFYIRDDVVAISKELLGKYLVTRFNGTQTAGMIVETEAYRGRDDKGCHANDNRRTKRTEVMYWEGGKAYVYLCYGIHHLFNVVTNREGLADAILIRAVEPAEGIEKMLKRRNFKNINHRLTAGPGSMSQALGITTEHWGEDLLGEKIWIEDRGLDLSEKEIFKGPRVGIDYAGEHAKYPWRFRIKDNEWVSRAK